MGLVDTVTEVAQALVPPHDAGPRAVLAWRWRIALVCCSSFFIGITAFYLAWHSYVAVARQHDYVLEIVNDQLIGTREKQCEETNNDAKKLYARELQWLESEYRDLTKAAYQMPACGDL
jgi:hypothetical protein